MGQVQPTNEAMRVIDASHTIGSVSDRIVRLPEQFPAKRGWLLLVAVAVPLVMVLLTGIAYRLYGGVGVWGINVPVAWGFAIVNFVWWIGIGHAGTLISAILLLMRQNWRTSINRFAEAMTLFAVANAGLFPLLHLGRIHRFYYLLPYPDTMGLWPQWRSPLVYDVFAVATYALVSFAFWYVGLIPDLATVRDRGSSRVGRWLAGVASLGWRGSARHWKNYKKLYLLLAGLATPLVVSVHSIVSFDFAVGMIPGWHSTVFPPYFVAGAIYSGFAMVFTVGVPLRKYLRLQDIVTLRHLDAMAKVMLAAGLFVAYGYVMEGFTAWYSANEFERYMVVNRATGPYAPAFWTMLVCNVGVLQALWFRKVRTSPVALFVLSLLINLGMWLERYVIVVTSLHRDFLPSSWAMYAGTVWDWALVVGTLGLFGLLTLLFVRVFPVASATELRELVHEVNVPEEASGPSDEVSQGHGAGGPPSGSTVMLAEFASPEALVRAAKRVRDAGFREVEAYTPFPVEELDEALSLPRSWMSPVVLSGALLGAAGGYFMQWYSAVVDYPVNAGGRPNHSWPSFLPLTFELAVLGGAVFGVLGLLAANRLPRLHHPLFAAPGFRRASHDRFLLSISTRDPRYDSGSTPNLLDDLEPVRVQEVPV